MWKKTEKPAQKNTKSSKDQKVKKSDRIPRTVMESIPYRSIYKNGIIEDYDGRFSKSYRLESVNFDTEEESQQESMVLAYEKLINCIDDGMIGQLTIINRSMDQDIVRNNVLMKPKNDGQNDLREEWNDVLLGRMGEGKNNLIKDKIFTVSVEAKDVMTASDILKRMDHDVSKNVRKINRQDTLPMTTEERMELLHDIYHCNSNIPFRKRIAPVTANGHLDLTLLGRYGMSSKELIAPDSMEFKGSSFMIGEETYAKAFYLDHLPTQMSTSILNDISSIPCNMIASVSFIQMDQDKALMLIKNQTNGMNAQINRMQAEAVKQGISNAGVVSTELENARDQASEMLNDVLKYNQKIWKVTCLIILMASSKEDLEHHAATLKSTVAAHLCLLRSMNYQQEASFNTALPLAQMHLEADRIHTSESASVFMPFSVQDLNQMGGMYYGVNPLSRNMIRYNRKNGVNYNAVVFGVSGSGKSYFVKQEIIQALLTTDDHVIVIDPENEYRAIGERFGATIIDLSLDGKTHINPLDMDIQFGGKGENPIPMKCDSIETLIESMVGGADSLSAVEKSIIHRVGRIIYNGYYNHIRGLAATSGITCDRAAMPTLQDFYAELCKQQEPQAQYMATAIESYCVGNYAVFSERTNVDTNNRFIIYNVEGMGSGMKELAMHVCMNDSWNHIINNGMKGTYTRLYIDEFHLFTKTRTSAAFMKNIYKRCRKWKGMATAITQNLSNMTVNEEAEAIIKNCSFVVMMNQSPMDRYKLKELYQFSSSMLDHITDQPPGNGLIYNGTTTVPMEGGDFTSETKMFKLMDSRKKEETA